MLAKSSHYRGKLEFKRVINDFGDSLITGTKQVIDGITCLFNNKTQPAYRKKVYSPPEALIEHLGCLYQATIVAQLHYLLAIADDGEFGFFIINRGECWKWITYTYAELAYQHFNWLPVRTLQNHILSLEDRGWIISGNFNDTAYYRRKWYRLDYEKIYQDTGWNFGGTAITQKRCIEYLEKVSHLYREEYLKQQQQERDLDIEETELTAIGYEANKGNLEDLQNLISEPPPQLANHQITSNKEAPRDLELEEAAKAATNKDLARQKEAYLQEKGYYSSEMLSFVTKYSIEELKKAIEVVTQRLQTKTVANKKGYLCQCLKGKWWEEEALPDAPQQVGQALQVEPPEYFEEWFELAKEQQLIHPQSRIEKLGKQAGEFIVEICNGGSFVQAVAMRISTAMGEYPIEKLRRQQV